MDPIMKVIIFVAAAIAAVTIVKTIAGAAVRYAEVHRREVGVDPRSIQDRLERIEYVPLQVTLPLQYESVAKSHDQSIQAKKRPGETGLFHINMRIAAA